jgi:parvulin-like peptidyl-prolyl isomerase
MMDGIRAPFARGLRVVLCLAIALSPVTLRAGKIEDRIVAVVNSDLIMLSDVKHELEPEQERLRRQHRGDELAHRLKVAEYMALTKMIERRLQLQEAKARGVDVSEQEVKQAVEQMKRQGEQVEVSNPVNARDVRDQLTLLKVVDREVRSGVMVGDAEMKRYYEEHRDRFALPEEYTLSQILIQPRSSEDTADALNRARRVMDELKRGEKFEDLAVQYSDGLDASRGGRLGFVRQGELIPAIERAIATLPPGGISDIIETAEGFHIIRVEEKKPKQFRPFEEVKFEIQGLVFQQKSEDVFQSWLVDLKNKAYIEIKF